MIGKKIEFSNNEKWVPGEIRHKGIVVDKVLVGEEYEAKQFHRDRGTEKRTEVVAVTMYVVQGDKGGVYIISPLVIRKIITD